MNPNRLLPALLVACIYALLISLMPAQTLQDNLLFIMSGLMVLLALTVSIKIKRKGKANEPRPDLPDMQSELQEHQD